METVVYLNVDEKSIGTRDGFLHFVGREGDEEAQKHSINLSGVKRYKFANDTLTVVFFPDEAQAPQMVDVGKTDFAEEFLGEALKELKGMEKALGLDDEDRDAD